MSEQTSERAPSWAPMLWFGLLLVLSYAPVLWGMGQEWLHDDDMGHGLFVPVVAGYIVWLERERIVKAPNGPNAWGLVLVVLGGLQLLAGTLGVEMFVSRTAFLVSLTGVVLYVGGVNGLRAVAFPLFLLAFMVRIPAIIYNQITFPLQMLASQVAEGSLSVIGIPVLREGNILELSGKRLSVVEACSGIRSLLSLTFLSLAYAYFFDSKVWMRGVLLVASVPIAVGANSFRVSLTGLLTEYKPEWAEGFFHSVEGWVVFLIALVALTSFHQILNRILKRA